MEVIMKRLLLSLLTLSLLGSSLVGMEQKQFNPLKGFEQSSQEKTFTIIAADGSEHKLAENYALCSETIKHQISDTSDGEIYLPYIKDKKHFDLISLFLGFTQEIQEFDQQCDAQDLSQDNKVILRRELLEELKNRSLKDLHQLILAFNYLDVPIILDAAIDELATRLSPKEKVIECLMKGYYEIAPNEKLELDINTAHAIAQRMLKKSAAKPWFLLQKLVGNTNNLPGKELIQKKYYGLLSYNEKKSMYALESANQIFLYDRHGKQIGKPLNGHGINRSHALFNHDGTLLACMYSDDILRIWDVETQKEIIHFDDAQWINSSFHFSPDSKFLVYVGTDKSINVIDLQTMALFKKISGVFPGHIQLSADGSMMAVHTRSHDGYNYVELFETRNFTSVKRLHFAANHGDIFLAIGGTKNFSKLAIAVKTNNYPGTKIIFYDTKKKPRFDNGMLLDDLYESSTQSSHEEIVLNRTCEYLVLHLNEDQTILVIAAQFCGERGDNLLMFDLKTKKQISHARIKGYFTTDITDNRLFSRGSYQYYHTEIANSDDKKEFETTIKSPEQAALLLGAYQCAQEGIPFTSKNYPGIKKITMPNCLKVFVATFYPESWSRWALRMAPAGLAIAGPLTAALLGSFKK